MCVHVRVLVWVGLLGFFIFFKEEKSTKICCFGGKMANLIRTGSHAFKGWGMNSFKVPDMKLRSVFHVLYLKSWPKTTSRQANLQYILHKVLLPF